MSKWWGKSLSLGLEEMIWFGFPLKTPSVSFGLVHQILTPLSAEVTPECWNAGTIKSSWTHESWWTIIAQNPSSQDLGSLCLYRPDTSPLLSSQLQQVQARSCKMSKRHMACAKFPSTLLPSQSCCSDDYSNLDSIRNVTKGIVKVLLWKGKRPRRACKRSAQWMR